MRASVAEQKYRAVQTVAQKPTPGFRLLAHAGQWPRPCALMTSGRVAPLSQPMNWRAVSVAAAWLGATFATFACGQLAYSGPSPCPAGSSAYQEADVALRLREGDRNRAFRLPLGEVVMTGAGYCSSGDALAVLKQQSCVQAC